MTSWGRQSSRCGHSAARWTYGTTWVSMGGVPQGGREGAPGSPSGEPVAGGGSLGAQSDGEGSVCEAQSDGGGRVYEPNLMWQEAKLGDLSLRRDAQTQESPLR